MRAERRAPVQQRHAVPPGCTAAPIQLARTPGDVSSGSGSAPWTRARKSIAWSPPSSLMSNLLSCHLVEVTADAHQLRMLEQHVLAQEGGSVRALQDDMQQVGTCRQPLEPHLGGGANASAVPSAVAIARVA